MVAVWMVMMRLEMVGVTDREGDVDEGSGKERSMKGQGRGMWN